MSTNSPPGLRGKEKEIDPKSVDVGQIERAEEVHPVNVRKIFGPPGTGKTTSLLTVVEEALASGIRPERIAFFTFTRKAAHEAIERACARFHLTEDRLPFFSTIHSLAFHSISARRDDIMQQHQFQELGRQLCFPFTRLDDELSLPTGTALGDRVAMIEALARVRTVPLRQQWEDSNYRDVPWLAVEQWAAGLRRYKESRGLMDFTDLLEQFEETLDVDLFIVDEAQDLSRLQWQVIRRAAGQSKEVLLAGDDDQCIYEWAGADLQKFLRVRGTTTVLPHSFRLPEKVHRLATRISEEIIERQPKQWTPRTEPGQVERVRHETQVDLTRGSWMLLARNRHNLLRWERMCQSAGYAYLKDNRSSTATADVRAILAWEAWRKGADLSAKDLRNLQEWAVPMTEENRRKNWMDAVLVPPARREYIRACLANGERLLERPRILISTIHRVKGGEADNVALLTDLSTKPWQQRGMDEEKRVLYVAVTRARERLVLVQPQTPRHYQI